MQRVRVVHRERLALSTAGQRRCQIHHQRLQKEAGKVGENSRMIRVGRCYNIYDLLVLSVQDTG